MSDNKEQALPFFARYLEDQFCEDLSEEEMSEVQGGTTLYTKKYPSDHEEGGCITSKFQDLVQTLKYPSDQEDGGGGVVSKKYPSDTDEFAVTQKYPSDGDDHSPDIAIS